MASSPSKSIPASPRTASRLRGLFIDGVWFCNCYNRKPAMKLQTKKEGPNKGKWFYTCQSYPNKCDFFLWASDAEAREKLLVLANSRSEQDDGTSVDSSIRTPSKTPAMRGMGNFDSNNNSGLLTPTTERKIRVLDIPSSTSMSGFDSEWRLRLRQGLDMGMAAEDPGSPSLLAKPPQDDDDDDGDGDEQDDEIERYLNARSGQRQQRQPQTPKRNYRQQRLGFPLDSSSVHTPRKTPRTTSFTSPGKLELENDDGNQQVRGRIHVGEADDPFISTATATTTPSSFLKGRDTSNINTTPMFSETQRHSHRHLQSSGMTISSNTVNNNSGLISPPPASLEISTTPTPTKTRHTNILQQPPFSSSQDAYLSSPPAGTAQPQSQSHPNLTKEILSLLESHHVVLPSSAQDQLIGLLDRYELRNKGIVRGRNITRLALKRKEERVRELEELLDGI